MPSRDYPFQLACQALYQPLYQRVLQELFPEKVFSTLGGVDGMCTCTHASWSIACTYIGPPSWTLIYRDIACVKSNRFQSVDLERSALSRTNSKQ